MTSLHEFSQILSGRRRRLLAWVVRSLVWTCACSTLTPATAEAQPHASVRAIDDVAIVTSKSYWTDLGGGMPLAPGSDPLASHGGLFVVSGELVNRSDRAVHHVVLRFELCDRTGTVLYQYDGYNRSAESMLRVEVDPQDAVALSQVRPIAPGARDWYRMIFVGEDIPIFDHPTVRVLTVE